MQTNTAYVPRIITPESLVSTRQTHQVIEPESNDTDEEIIERLRTRFQILEDMARAVKKGDVRAMIVSGAPGVGKSFGIESVLSKHDLLANIAQDDTLKKYEIVKGTMSSVMLFKKLWDFRDKKCVLVLDDCDSVLGDEVSLNMLKTALDSGSKRTISWNTDSRLLKEEGIPNTFDFEGGMIFVTNIKFDHVRSKKLKDHLDALESRCHYLDLSIHTEREKMLRIRQIVDDGMLDKFGFDQEQVEEIVQFICDNKKYARELSLRTVIKAAELRKSMPKTWKDVARMTLMRR